MFVHILQFRPLIYLWKLNVRLILRYHHRRLLYGQIVSILHVLIITGVISFGNRRCLRLSTRLASRFEPAPIGLHRIKIVSCLLRNSVDYGIYGDNFGTLAMRN